MKHAQNSSLADVLNVCDVHVPPLPEAEATSTSYAHDPDKSTTHKARLSQFPGMLAAAVTTFEGFAAAARQ